MKLFMLFIIFYPLSNCAMELARAQDQASRLLAQRGLQDQARLHASEEQRKTLALAVQREREKITELEAQLHALRTANNVTVESDTQKTHFLPTQWNTIERSAAFVGVAVISGMIGYWCGAKNTTTLVAQDENKK